MKFLLTALTSLTLCMPVVSQYIFSIPSHYHGLFSHQLSSARAQGMGYTTITTDGIGTSIYNPATISPGNAMLDVSFNYAAGHPYYPKSYYPFLGVSYRVLPRLVVGASTFAWIDPDSYWTATIAGQDFDTDKKTQRMHSLTAAYEVIDGLHVGLSGNLIREQAVKGSTTIKEFIMNMGAIYDRDVELIQHTRLINQKVRFAFSLTNMLMNAKTEQRYQDDLNYRDMPIILRLGTGYGFSLPVKASFARNKKFFAESPEILDLFFRVQYQNFLKHKDHIYRDHEYSSAFGIGAEAWFMKLLALRLGYYTEKRADSDDDPGILATTDNKSGFTWGFGGNIPLQRLTGGKVPFDIEANFVTSKMMNELHDDRYNLPGGFRDKRFQFCAGLNIRWNKK